MAHSSEIRWSEVSGRVNMVAVSLTNALRQAEEEYQELLEAYVYAGGTDTLFAGLMFATPAPDASQISKATDIRLAMVAAHELFQAMTNVSISQANRASVLRRMT